VLDPRNQARSRQKAGGSARAAAKPKKPSRGTGLQTVGLFAGIGGLELGLNNAGHETKLLCEIDPGAQAVLAEHFPDAKLAEDVCGLTRGDTDVDLLVGGFPCQDLSQAGRTAGIDGSKSGLVRRVFELVRGRGRRGRVPIVLLENVPFMLSLRRGSAMSLLADEFEAMKYRWAYRVIDTRAFGLPQRRKRVFILAMLDGDPADVLFGEDAGERPEPDFDGTQACGFYWTEGSRGLGWAVNAIPTLKGGSGYGVPSPPAVWVPGEGIFTPGIEVAEALQGFERGWTEPSTDKDQGVRPSHRWKLVGNAVSVPVAEWLGERLLGAGDPGGGERKSRPLGRHERWPQAACYDGTRRLVVEATPSPVKKRRRALRTVLGTDRKELSLRASEGFWSRLNASNLRREKQFERELRAHVGKMRRASRA